MIPIPDVIARGTDSSGRPILASAEAWAWWDGLVYQLGWEPVIVQGGWGPLRGGGAGASEGTHDKDAFDLRTRDLTDQQKADLVRIWRAGGGPGWVRDLEHGGFDEHFHGLPGAGFFSPEALAQFALYRAGFDGLASRGEDYHPRPNPLVTKVPKGFIMPTAQEIAAAVAPAVWGERLRPVGAETDEAIAAGRMLAQVHNRTDADRLGALIAQIEPTLDQATVTAALKQAFKQIGETP